jgi:hypothetical protein
VAVCTVSDDESTVHRASVKLTWTASELSMYTPVPRRQPACACSAWQSRRGWGPHGIASAIWQHPWSWDPGIYATNSPSAQKIVEGVLCSMTVCHASVTFKCLRCQALNSSCEWSQWSVLSSNRVSRFRLNFRIGGILQCKSPSFSKRGRGCLGCRMMAGA